MSRLALSITRNTITAGRLSAPSTAIRRMDCMHFAFAFGAFPPPIWEAAWPLRSMFLLACTAIATGMFGYREFCVHPNHGRKSVHSRMALQRGLLVALVALVATACNSEITAPAEQQGLDVLGDSSTLGLPVVTPRFDWGDETVTCWPGEEGGEYIICEEEMCFEESPDHYSCNNGCDVWTGDVMGYYCPFLDEDGDGEHDGGGDPGDGAEPPENDARPNLAPDCDNPRDEFEATWCVSSAPFPTQQARIGYALDRMRAKGPPCDTLAMAIDTLLARGWLRLHNQETFPHGGYAPNGAKIGPRAYMGLASFFTDEAYDAAHADATGRTLQSMLAHEADHLWYSATHSDPAGNWTTRAEQCDDMP